MYDMKRNTISLVFAALLAGCAMPSANALRANLVHNVADWPWSSLGRRVGSDRPPPLVTSAILADWPLPRPDDWLNLVNTPQTESELAALRQSVKRGRPYGDSEWIANTANRLRINSTLRQRGRPKKRISRAH